MNIHDKFYNSLPRFPVSFLLMRRIVICTWLMLLFGCIVGIFWYNDWKYNIPTPVPADYYSVPIGTVLAINAGNTIAGDKPLFLHFFNPDCPCSRFNITHVRDLIRKYGSKTNFKLVLVTNKQYTASEIQERFDVDVDVLNDSGLSKACGVYSTPQAVIIDATQKLYYRGNYNRSRYCTDKKTNYAEAAIVQLINNNYSNFFASGALKAYGCELPGCKKP